LKYKTDFPVIITPPQRFTATISAKLRRHVFPVVSHNIYFLFIYLLSFGLLLHKEKKKKKRKKKKKKTQTAKQNKMARGAATA